MIEISEIKQILPHRYPMLLLDRITEVIPGDRLTALKAVTCNEPWYQALADGATLEGHAYPPVLLIESWCQAAGVLAAWHQRNPDVLAGKVMLFGGITGIRFHGRVLPSDVLEHTVRLVRALSDTAVLEGETLVGSSAVLEVGRVVMALRPATSFQVPGARPGPHPQSALR